MLVLENPSSTFHYVSFKIIFSLTILKYLLFSCFLYITPKAQLTKEKVVKLDFIKITNFHVSKDTIKKMMGGKILQIISKFILCVCIHTHTHTHIYIERETIQHI